MSAKERILTIRLMEKLRACPETAKALGIEVRAEKVSTDPVGKREK